MKKLFALLMALSMMLILLTGCAASAAPAEPAPESSSLPEPEPEPEPTTVEGVIKEATPDKIIVSLTDGTNLSFRTAGLLSLEVHPGDTVSVEYTGVPGSAVASKVEITKAAPTPVSVSGVVSEASASMALLTLEDESELVLLLSDLENLALHPGDKVTAEYLQGENGAVASALEVVESAVSDEATADGSTVPATGSQSAAPKAQAPAPSAKKAAPAFQAVPLSADSVLTVQAKSKPTQSEEFSQSYLGSVYYQRLKAVSLTGDYRTDLLAVADSQLGYRESSDKSKLDGSGSGSGDCTEYGRFCGTNGTAWCSEFTSWCARQAGISTRVLGTSTSAQASRFGGTYHPWSDTVYAGGRFQPRPGDLVLFAWSKGSRTAATKDHTGIFYADNWSDKSLVIQTIDGNSGGSVEYNSRRVTDMGEGKIPQGWIAGFVAPNYGDGDGMVDAPRKPEEVQNLPVQPSLPEQAEEVPAQPEQTAVAEQPDPMSQLDESSAPDSQPEESAPESQPEQSSAPEKESEQSVAPEYLPQQAEVPQDVADSSPAPQAEPAPQSELPSPPSSEETSSVESFATAPARLP